MYINVKISEDNDADKENVPPVSQSSSKKYSFENLISEMKISYNELNPWQLLFQSDKYVEMCLYDKKLIDGKQIFRTLKIFDDLSWATTYAGCSLPNSSISGFLPTNDKNFTDFVSILRKIQNSKICCGAK